MNTESNKVLLLSIGDTGLEVVRIIDNNEAVSGLKAFGIKKESDLKQLTDNEIDEAGLVILAANLGNQKENSLALQTVESAKNMGKTVAAFLTTPRLFEGKKTIMRALETAQKVGQVADTSLIINEEAFSTPPADGCSFAELINSLVSVEETIAEGIQNMMYLISESGVINIDWEDLKTSLSESGTFTVGSGIGAGENRIKQAIENALSSPVMRNCDIFTSRKVLIKILAPKNSPITMEETKIMSEFIGKFPSHTDMKWGVGEADDDDIASVIILVSGFDVKLPE